MKICNLQQLCLQELKDVVGGGDMKCICITYDHTYGIEGVFNSNDCADKCCVKLEKNSDFASKAANGPIIIGYAFTNNNDKTHTVGGCTNKLEGRMFSKAIKDEQNYYEKSNNQW